MSDRKVRELLELPEPFYVTDARKVLETYYEEPVYPVSQVCAKIDDWIAVMEELDVRARAAGESWWHGKDFVGTLRTVRLNIAKSNLLARLLYGREKLRTRPCLIHNGSWSGVEGFGDRWPCGCQGTGWLPDTGSSTTPSENLTAYRESKSE